MPRDKGGRLGVGLVARLLFLALPACEPTLTVGTWSCESAPDYDPAAERDPVAAPWSTGFEADFCDFTSVGGFCYADPDASYQIVDEPVRSGRHAAAFSVTTDSSQNGWESRCVRQGVLPVDATYGAWFFLPTLSTTTDNWNLLHFQGGEPDDWHGLWDVSLGTASDQSLQLQLYDFLNATTRTPEVTVPIPIGSWFHVEFQLRRANTETGQVSLFQDGVLLLEVHDIVTDDTEIGQWYLGNLAKALEPAGSTLFVDDVTLEVTP